MNQAGAAQGTARRPGTARDGGPRMHKTSDVQPDTQTAPLPEGRGAVACVSPGGA
jgi:hypothetical protein